MQRHWHAVGETICRKNGEPAATCFIRETTGAVGVRDNKVNIIHLPPHLSVCGIYCGYIHHSGYQLPSPDDKGNCGQMTSFKLRKNDETDLEWPSDQDPNPICSYSCFWKIWRTYCPFIIIRKPSKDIRGDCYVFANHLLYGARNPDQINETIDDEALDDQSDTIPPNASAEDEDKDEYFFPSGYPIGTVNEARTCAEADTQSEPQGDANESPEAAKELEVEYDY